MLVYLTKNCNAFVYMYTKGLDLTINEPTDKGKVKSVEKDLRKGSGGTIRRDMVVKQRLDSWDVQKGNLCRTRLESNKLILKWINPRFSCLSDVYCGTRPRTNTR